MKLNSMDAVNMNIGVAQVKVVQNSDAASESVAYSNNPEKAVGFPQKTYTVKTSGNSGESKKFQQDDQPDDKMLKDAIEKVNKVISADSRKFEITIHEKTKDILVRVIDTDTNETIKEIPPKKIVDIVVNLCELAGIIFDAKG